MKRIKHSTLLLVLALCLLLPLVACVTSPDTTPSTESEQASSAQADTQTETEPQTESLTQTETEPPEQAEIDYYPGMSYVKTETQIAVDGFDTALLGQVIGADTKGHAALGEF